MIPTATPVNQRRAQLLAEAVIAGYINDISGGTRVERASSPRPAPRAHSARIHQRRRTLLPPSRGWSNANGIQRQAV